MDEGSIQRRSLQPKRLKAKTSTGAPLTERGYVSSQMNVKDRDSARTIQTRFHQLGPLSAVTDKKDDGDDE